MWTESEIYKEDLQAISNDPGIPWAKLHGKTILVTGATGLIGKTIVDAILYYGMEMKNPPRIVALVRNLEKARASFFSQINECKDNLKIVVGDVRTVQITENIDYIIHCASRTSSQDFVNHPVDTLETALLGTVNILNLAKFFSIKGMVYLSSMEVYGHPEKGMRVTEEDVAGFDPEKVRNCYPISKIACESLCNSFATEYGIPITIARLTQTMGPGVSVNDTRVFAEFMNCALEGEDIILKTKGETERCYVYTTDAVRAILTILLKGVPGQAYSVANDKTYCSIAEMAEVVVESIGRNASKVIYDIQDIGKYGYADTLYMYLDTYKIRRLGWEAKIDLKDMYKRMAKARLSEESDNEKR